MKMQQVRPEDIFGFDLSEFSTKDKLEKQVAMMEHLYAEKTEEKWKSNFNHFLFLQVLLYQRILVKNDHWAYNLTLKEGLVGFGIEYWLDWLLL